MCAAVEGRGVGATLTFDGDGMHVSLTPPVISHERPADSLQVSVEHAIADLHPAPLLPVNTSRIEHGVAPVEFIPDPADTAPATWQELQADITRQLRGE